MFLSIVIELQGCNKLIVAELSDKGKLWSVAIDCVSYKVRDTSRCTTNRCKKGVECQGERSYVCTRTCTYVRATLPFPFFLFFINRIYG